MLNELHTVKVLLQTLNNFTRTQNSQNLLRNNFSHFFLSSSGRGHLSPCPLPKAPLKALLYFLSTPLLILSKSLSFY